MTPPEYVQRLPLAEGPRTRMRLAVYETETLRAFQRARLARCSLWCEWGDHHDRSRPEYGCQNDGTSCLCICHDQRLPGSS